MANAINNIVTEGTIYFKATLALVNGVVSDYEGETQKEAPLKATRS